jgi:uncharacterized membrane protein YedE/YeeE
MNLLVSTPNTFWEWISQPWPWYAVGASIALTMMLLTYLGQSFGVSTSFKAMCSMAGAGRSIPFFNMDLKKEAWRITFVVGSIIGGAIAAVFFASPDPVAISPATVANLQELGLQYPQADATGRGFVPTELYNFGSLKGLLLALGGGFLIGFGARYGRGCTSGHAISGLAHLQLPSLITVIGFFIGGLLMTHMLLPFLI